MLTQRIKNILGDIATNYRENWPIYDVLINQHPYLLFPIFTINFQESFGCYKAKAPTALEQKAISLYRDFINDYKDLIVELNKTNPVEIYATYLFCLKNGYLSHEKQFGYGKIPRESSNLPEGIYILTGNGVCTHISTFLHSIYSSLDIPSAVLAFSMKDSYFSVKKSIKKTDLEEFLRIMNENNLDPNLRKRIMDDFNNLFDENEKLRLKLDVEYIHDNRLLSLFANHVINGVQQDNMNYFFDPTNEDILRRGDKKSKLLGNNGSIYLYKSLGTKDRKTLLLLNGDTSDINSLDFKKLDQDCDSDVSLSKTIEHRALCECERQKEVFEDFYKEHEELYEEVNDILVRCRTKRR